MPFQLWQSRTYELASYYIIDGDTLDVEIADEYPPRQQHRIRLHGLDAPELAQPYGVESTQFLANLLARHSRIFVYVTQEADRYERTVGILHAGNLSNSMNAQLVRAGLAYAYYANDYRDAEYAARNAHAGVWQQRDGGERPWNYRNVRAGKATTGPARRDQPGPGQKRNADRNLVPVIICAVALLAIIAIASLSC